MESEKLAANNKSAHSQFWLMLTEDDADDAGDADKWRKSAGDKMDDTIKDKSDKDFEAFKKKREEFHTANKNKLNSHIETRIRRLNSASYQRGLTMLLDAKSDEYFVTSDEFVGFKVKIKQSE